jgi:protein-arginine kinase activator protein McsA
MNYKEMTPNQRLVEVNKLIGQGKTVFKACTIVGMTLSDWFELSQKGCANCSRLEAQISEMRGAAEAIVTHVKKMFF